MESFEFIESGIVFGLESPKAILQFRYTTKDFAIHGDAYEFLLRHFDNYGEFPSPEILQENFPTLDPAAQTLQLEYTLDSFKRQVLYRQIVGVFQDNKPLLQDDPKKAYASITTALNDVCVVYDEDVVPYGSGALTRYEEWQARNAQRNIQGGILGMPTIFDAINKTGVGWLSGELISVFARPSIGKTWLLVHSAAVAASQGYKTLLISTEMPLSAISLRAAVIMANIMGYNFSHRALRSGEAIDENAYKTFLQELDGRPLLICDHIAGQNGITLSSIANLIRKHSPDFVVIDGVYLIQSGNGRRQAWEESHALFYGLKNLCTSNDVSMLAATQANRDAADIYRPPQADQVAFGDALLSASDVVLSMCEVEDMPTRRLIQYQKYRDAESFVETSVMHWNPDIGEIYEVNPDY